MSLPRTCSVENCGQPIHYKKLGYCSKHYRRWYEHGDPTVVLRINKAETNCTVDGCDKPYLAKGLCNIHYLRNKFDLTRSTWLGMKRRCLDTKYKPYGEYGGRGITLDPRWLNYDNFLADMGARPSRAHSIDRINNDGNYEPSNCRWADKTTQNINQRDRKDNTSGTKGVNWHSAEQRWIARISVGGKRIVLGHFKDIEDAIKARLSAEEQHYA